MQWVTIGSVDDLRPYLVSVQVDAINAAALGPGQNERFEDVVATISTRIRTKVASQRTNVLSATDSAIPPELAWIAALLIIEAMQAGIPGLDLTEDQRRLIDRGEKDLDAIVRGELKVSTPDDPLVPTPVQRGGGAQVVSQSCEPTAPERMRGL